MQTKRTVLALPQTSYALRPSTTLSASLSCTVSAIARLEHSHSHCHAPHSQLSHYSSHARARCLHCYCPSCRLLSARSSSSLFTQYTSPPTHTHTHTHTHFTHTLFLHLLTHTHTLTHTYNLVLLSVYMRERVDGTRLTPLHTCPRWPLGQICSASRSSARRSARLEATSGLGIHTSVCVSV